MSIKKGFNTRAGETRNGTHFTMKGVTANELGVCCANLKSSVRRHFQRIFYLQFRSRPILLVPG